MGATGYRRAYGVDFSGARDAGDRIWIASGVVEKDTLRIEACCRARELPVAGLAAESQNVKRETQGEQW